MVSPLTPVVFYRDPMAALRWLEQAFGFETSLLVTDDKGRKVAVLIDLKKHGARLQDFWDGLISESRRKEKGIPLEKVKPGQTRPPSWITRSSR